jgi:dienelactone hydrolase
MPWLPTPHPDAITGLLAGIVQSFSHSNPDTLRDADAYAGVPIETLFPAPARVPDVRLRRRWSLPGLVSDSPHEPHEPRFAQRYQAEYAENHTVYARRVRPTGAVERPRLLYLHGYMQPETYLEEFGILASLAWWLDVEVIQLQPPYHGRRRPRRSRFDGEYYWTADVVRSFEALRQTVLDARALLAWLLDQDDRPVGVAGVSLGGAVTCALTCLEERFAFSVPIVGHMDLSRLLADAPVLGRMRDELRHRGWGPAEFGDFIARTGWDDLVPKISRDRIRLFAASDDRFFEPDAVTAMWRRWGEPEIEWYRCSHMGFFLQAPRAMRSLRSFIDEQAGVIESGETWATTTTIG